MADSDLPALVARAQKGDRAAFDKIVHHTARLVYAQIVAAVRDRQKAEDLCQETYVAAWKALPSVHAENTAGTFAWLLTLARNKVLDARKSDTRQKRGGVVPTPPSAGPESPQVVPTPPSAVRDSPTKPTRASAPLEGLPDDGPSPQQIAERAEARDHALRLLEELPEEYRRPLAMRYLTGADYYTIRRALDLTDGALRGLLNRGMALLRERMSRLETRNTKLETSEDRP